MLGKLLKYEFKATFRTLVPLYGCLIIFTVLNKLFSLIDNDRLSSITDIPSTLLMIGYVLTMVSIFIITVVVIIQRFSKNLLMDEGYLMHTLPVYPYMNVLSKLIIAVVWSIISFFVAIISILIMTLGGDLFRQIPQFIEELFMLDFQGLAYVIQMILGGLTNTILGILVIYASITIGYTFNEYKKLCSFGAFILINFVTNFISAIFQIVMMMIFDTLPMSTTLNFYFSFSVALNTLMCVGLFFVINYLMKNKLNLE